MLHDFKVTKTMRHANGSERETSGMLKIGEVAKRSGVGVEALRFYEKSGLLDRPPRTASGYRMYSESVLERIAFIKQAQALGFSLTEIKLLITEKQKGQSPCAEAREIVRARLSDLNDRIAELMQHRRDLIATLHDWDLEGEADGHVCGLIESSRVGSHPPASGGLERLGRDKPGERVKH